MTVLRVVAVLATAVAAARGGEGPRGWASTGPAYWIELQLELIRRDRPLPTVQARNLFHVSMAMHDAWAAFDPDARGFLADESADPPAGDRPVRIAVGHAAMGVLRHRYALTNRDGLALLKFERSLRDAGLLEPLEGEERAAAELGGRIATRIIEAALDDGSNELGRYLDHTRFKPVNEPLDPWRSGAAMHNPDRWQALIVNGRTQRTATPYWGGVRPFALDHERDGSPYLDPGPPPMLNERDHPVIAAAMVELILLSSRLEGREDDPEADFGRVVAEYWEDGPATESPPGHWNLLALQAAGRAGPEPGTRERLAWEVRLFAALNGALHDAAVACWDLKFFYQSVRPISLIRHMGALGQSSHPGCPGYHPLGLPIVPGLIEMVTEESATPGGRHHGLNIGEIAVFCWRGNPQNLNTQTAGVGWIPATSWMPYQDAEFITPPFPGYPSGHSTFSAAAAAVLAWHFGGDEIPGGPLEFVAPPGQFLSYERGPGWETVLRWARFSQAADQAGRSRLWGGIHPWFDDLPGRAVGQRVAHAVIARFQ